MPIHDWTRVDDGVFHDFHGSWITAIRTALNTGLLPDGFYALAEQSAGDIGPDVLSLERRDEDDAPAGENVAGSKAVAVAPPRVKWVFHRERDFYLRKQRRIAIRHKSGDRLVAVLEIISPGNKSSQREFQRFIQKAIEVLRQDIHLLVLDLFPPTSRDPQGIHGAIWSELGEDEFEMSPEKPLTLAAYATEHEITAYVEPLAVGDALIDMPLFLTDETYVDVPLERTYLEAWQGVPKHLRHRLEQP